MASPSNEPTMASSSTLAEQQITSIEMVVQMELSAEEKISLTLSLLDASVKNPEALKEPLSPRAARQAASVDYCQAVMDVLDADTARKTLTKAQRRTLTRVTEVMAGRRLTQSEKRERSKRKKQRRAEAKAAAASSGRVIMGVDIKGEELSDVQRYVKVEPDLPQPPSSLMGPPQDMPKGMRMRKSENPNRIAIPMRVEAEKMEGHQPEDIDIRAGRPKRTKSEKKQLKRDKAERAFALAIATRAAQRAPYELSDGFEPIRDHSKDFPTDLPMKSSGSIPLSGRGIRKLPTLPAGVRIKMEPED